MANTYELIASNIISGTTTSTLTLSSIPATYTDLVLRMSMRVDGALNNDPLAIRVNGLSTTIYSFLHMQGTGSSASSSITSSDTSLNFNTVQGSLYTADTFTSLEFYFSNYAGSNNKTVSGISHSENNATSGLTRVTANLIQTTSAINSITIYSLGGYNFIAGSSVYLYGIKNS